MEQKLSTPVAQMVEAAKSSIEEISIEDAIASVDAADVTIVDIRDIRERQREGFIPGSLHCPRGMVEFWIDPESPYYNKRFSESSRFLFHCAVDWRSALTVETVNKMGFNGALNVKGGFKAWKEAGGPVEHYPEKK